MPRLTPDATILIRQKGERKWNKVEIFHRGTVGYRRVKIRANGKWLGKNTDFSIPWYSFRDILWRSIGRKFIRGDEK